MKVWYDACTGKHIRYGVAIANKLRNRGHEVILTTRKHADTIGLMRVLNEKFEVLGEYSAGNLLEKLRASVERQKLLFEFFMKKMPNVAISHGSVEQCRVAFGASIPIILTHDSPHAVAVNRLTLPLCSFLVVPKAIPKRYIKMYGVKKIYRFNGVDEVAWIKDFKPLVKYDFKRPLIVVRQMESKAVYAGKMPDISEILAKKLTALGNVIFLPRYDRMPRNNLIVPRNFIDSASLVSQADLVVGFGGTISREAALLGTPSIVVNVFGRLYVNEFLRKRGFPIFITKVDNVLTLAKKMLGRKWKTTHLIKSLEDPVDVIERILETEIGK